MGCIIRYRMKTSFSLLLSLLFALTASQAQNFRGGIQLGLNASQVDGDGSGGFNQAGIAGGGYLRYRLNDRWGIGPELLYEQLGSADRLGKILRSHHISVPVMVSVEAPIDLGDMQQELEFMAGPVGGYLIQASDFNLDITRSLNRFDLRAVAGLAYHTGDFSFLVRYGYSVFPFQGGRINGVLFPQGGPFHHYVQFLVRLQLTEGR